MARVAQIAKLEARVKLYEDVVSSFEQAREKMQDRQHGTIDAVMDDSLALNEKALTSLRQVLATARHQLERERSRVDVA